MDNGTLTPNDMLDAKIKLEDFNLVLSDIDKNKKSKERKPIGFNK